MHPRGLGISRKIKIVILPLIAAILTAFYVTMDKYYLSEISSNAYAYGFLSMWIGVVATGLFLLLMRVPYRKKELLGSFIDPNFHGFIIPKGKLLLLLFIAGLSSAVSTFSYFHIVAASSATIVLPFMQVVVVYLIFAEIITEKEIPTALETQSIIMILIGVFLMATTDITVNWMTILLVFGPYNISMTVFTIALRKAKRLIHQHRKNDSLNLRFWSMTFNTILLTFLIIPFMDADFYNVLISLNPYIVTYIVVVMLISTFAFITYIRALGIAKMSIVTSIISFSIVLGIPITFIGNFFFPGVFGSTTFDPLFWLFKGMGILLIIIGIIVIGISQIKAYLMIYLSGPATNVIAKLSRIKEIKSISAVSGALLLIAELRFRSFGNAYRTLVTAIEEIEGIKQVITLNSLKEWEKL